jgi:phosphotriesterase-related protein
VTSPPPDATTTVTTVTGPVDSSDLGVCLTHEHLINDASSWWHRSASPGVDADEFAAGPVRPEILWDLKHDPFGNRDNCRLDDVGTAVAELARFAALGGRTVLEATCLGIGRDLRRLREISERTGVNVVAGTGYYLEASHPAAIAGLGAEEVAALILADLRDGEDGVRPGFIGEIGVSEHFTPAERTGLAAAAIAQREVDLPVQVHLPGWFRHGLEVLDLLAGYGVPAEAVVLCHMNPSGDDQPYQRRLAERGAWIQYDMIGAEVFYADQGVQCPSDEDDARHVTALLEAGFGHRVLLSSDVFLKSLLRIHGGPGYAHVLQYFVPRLERHGVSTEQIRTLLVDNPRSLFETAAAVSAGRQAGGPGRPGDTR